MSAQGIYKITEDFEQALCNYTGAPYAVAVDNCSNAIWCALKVNMTPGQTVTIPKHTYPSVPAEIIMAGGHVKFVQVMLGYCYGAYHLEPTDVWDSALSFTADMYKKGSLMCLSFTGPYKHLKLGKGGAILLDDKDKYELLKQLRFSGRHECSYHEDKFDVIGRNCYMLPEIAARGILLMQQFYNPDGSKRHNPDILLRYPDLSKFPVYTQ